MAKIDINRIRRGQIMEATRELLVEKGWSEASISEITKRADVSRGLVSYHFRDKEEILSAVLERECQSFAERVDEATEQHESPRDRMLALIRLAVDLMRGEPAVYAVFLNYWAQGPYDAGLRRQIREQWSLFRRALARQIQDGVQRGDFHPTDPRAAASMVFGTLLGLALQHLIDPDGLDLEAASAAVEDSVMRYLGEGKTPAREMVAAN